MEIRTISQTLKKKYGQKIYRLSLSSGCTCPNRDGRIGYGGCTFCSEGGSGEFSAECADLESQIAHAKKLVDRKISGKIPAERRRYIAYFQSFTNTYVHSPEELRHLQILYTSAITRNDIVVLSIGTRPDCLDDSVLDMLDTVRAAAPEKEIWIELGLQTAHDRTAERIHRGYDRSVFADAYRRLKARHYPVILHMILGLPGEGEADMLTSMAYVAALHPVPDGIKLQMLQILRGTQMAEQYETEHFPVMSREEYSALIVKCLRILPQETVIHRITGDGPRELLIEPKWCLDKKKTLNLLNRKIAEA